MTSFAYKTNQHDLPKDYIPNQLQETLRKKAEYYTKVLIKKVKYDQDTWISYPGRNPGKRKFDYGPCWRNKRADKYGIKFHCDSNSAEDKISIYNFGEETGIQYANKLGIGYHTIQKKRRSLHIQYGIASRCVKHRPVNADGDHMSFVLRSFTNKYKKNNQL